MPLSTPYGSTALSLPRLRMCELIAASPTFRTVVGAGDSTSALAHIHSPYSDDHYQLDESGIPLRDDNGLVILANPRPRAIVNHNTHSRTILGTAFGATKGSLIVTFEFPPDPAAGGDLNQELASFEEQLGKILDEMESRARSDKLSGEAVYTANEDPPTAHLNLGDYEIEVGPAACIEQQEGGQTFYAAVLVMQHNG